MSIGCENEVKQQRMREDGKAGNKGGNASIKVIILIYESYCHYTVSCYSNHNGLWSDSLHIVLLINTFLALERI